MGKRAYNKKSDYWSKFDRSQAIAPNIPEEPAIKNIEYQFSGGGIMEKSVATRTGSDRSGNTSSRSNRASQGITPNKYGAINEGLLPYCYSKDGVDVGTAIYLCQKAYANVPIVKNSVDLMAEFANGEIILEGGNEASRKFFEAWFSVIKLPHIKSEYFLEYYRGSNIFFYKNNGKLSADAIKKLAQYMNVKSRTDKEVPLEYILLNPVDIVADNASSFSNRIRQFTKVLSQYELERLKSPKNEQDKAILETFSEEDRKKIKSGNFQKDGIRVTLDPSRLLYSFAKKQDYEPFAIPFIFPILSDVNMKLELKKLDQAVMRTIENVILLITMGAKPDDGGINYQNLASMQSLFGNESVGRVLVSDYTTKADFIIPDIAKVVGKEKYEVLNEDIREGLQNIVTGEDKYASTAIKAQLFLERLSESRSAFLNDFLIPEMYAVANALGFKNVPKPVFRETTLKDEVQWMRGVTRLMELSILTPEEGVEAIKNGRLPTTEEFETNQRTYKKQKDGGLYSPLIGGGNKEEKKENGRPTGSKAANEEKITVTQIQKAIYATEELFKMAERLSDKKGWDKERKALALDLCRSIIEAKERCDWKRELNNCFECPTEIPVYLPAEDVLSIAAEHNISTYEAAIIKHGRKLP